jgi:hypothetical protein
LSAYDPLALAGRQFRILRDGLVYLIGGELLLFAKGFGLNVGFWNSLLCC